MTTELASGDLVSDRYASALYDLASEKKIVDHVLTDLLLIKEIIDKHEELKLVIKSPLIVSNDKLKILQKITNSKKINELSSTFLKVISKNKRFPSLFSIISQFININAHKRGDVLADVTSADKLSEDQQLNIKNQLSSILGDKLSLSFQVDKKIIGGLIIKVGSKMIDTSVANKINKLKIAMKGA
mgnify:FL=1|tara:strand:- start:211 stop:768 length:558 start_codon:yes stop_codon:yes gene_type:complete